MNPAVAALATCPALKQPLCHLHDFTQKKTKNLNNEFSRALAAVKVLMDRISVVIASRMSM